MQSASIVRESHIKRSARVAQIEAMFDVPTAEKSSMKWEVSLPKNDDDWSIGLIVGPSGAGKSTIAKELYGDFMVDDWTWRDDHPVIDDFPESMSIKEISKFLTSVGFSTIPAWLRPYSVLSNGEKFRVHMARTLCETQDLVVIDEFTSVVDRKVAQVACHSLQKTIRREKRRFIAVSCHYDIIDWLQPDWIYEPHGPHFQRRSLRCRPELDIEIYPVDKQAWRVFSKHHYLSDILHSAATCIGAFYKGECIAFSSWRHFPHPRVKDIKMGHRLVVLPDYQGLGIGGALDDWAGEYLHKNDYRYHNVVAHPAMIAFYNKSPRWKCLRHGKLSGGSLSAKEPGKGSHIKEKQKRFSSHRVSLSFEYIPLKLRRHANS